MVKTFYECDYCGEYYETEIEASACEKKCLLADDCSHKHYYFGFGGLVCEITKFCVDCDAVIDVARCDKETYYEAIEAAFDYIKMSKENEVS